MDFVHNDDEDDLHAIGVRICYQGGWFAYFLALFMFSPLGILLVGNGVSFLYGIDVALFLVYNIGVSLNWLLAWGLNRWLKDPRPEFAARCDWTTYGTPDYFYVMSVSMLFILAFVGFAGITRIRIFSASIFIFLIAMYSYASWYLGYLTTVQTIDNLNLSLGLGLFWFLVYVKVLGPYDTWLSEFRVLRWLGFNDLLAVPDQKTLH